MDEPEWLSSRETLSLFETAGVGRETIDDLVSWSGSWRRLPINGMREVGWDVDLDQHNPMRAEIPMHYWDAWRRVRYRADDPSAEVGEGSHASIDWEAGSTVYVWTSLPEMNPRIQLLAPPDLGERELWYSLQFDRLSVQSLIREHDSKQQAGLLQEHEIVGWIETACLTENGKDAWVLLGKHFGTKRRGKKPEFERIWNEVKGHRGRGRPAKRG